MAKSSTKKTPKFALNIKGDLASSETDSRDLKITERPDVKDGSDRSYAVEAIDVLDKDYADKIAFFEEPVKIILHPGTEENAATSFPVWNNGKMAEVFQRGRWDEIGYLPLNKPIVVKRKILETIISAKITQIKTDHDSESRRPDGYIENKQKSFTRPLNGFSVLEDKNPRGHEWLSEKMNRNM